MEADTRTSTSDPSIASRAPRPEPTWSSPLPTGIERVYHYHVRKTAGTSLNSAFWSLIGLDSEAFIRVGWRAERGGLIMVRHDPDLIRDGDWFFASSHAAAQNVTLPERTYTVTVMRDPTRRLISYYEYLRYLDAAGGGDGTHPQERAWAQRPFVEFAYRIPRLHREAQLCMFSTSFSVEEGLARVGNVDAVLFTEQFAAGMDRLGRRLGLNLPLRDERRFPHLAEVSPTEVDAVQDLLAAEYEFVDAVRHARGFDDRDHPADETSLRQSD